MYLIKTEYILHIVRHKQNREHNIKQETFQQSKRQEEDVRLVNKYCMTGNQAIARVPLLDLR